MHDSGESCKEATDRKMEVLNAKTKTRIGFWNMQTMYQMSKLVQITAEMQRYGLHIPWESVRAVKTENHCGRDCAVFWKR